MAHWAEFGGRAARWRPRRWPATAPRRYWWSRPGPLRSTRWSAQFVPDGDTQRWAEFAELQRRTASGEAARELLDACYHLDARDVAPQVDAEALVIHPKGDQVVAFERGRELAALLPRSRFVPLDSANHLLQADEPAWDTFVAELDGFVGN